MARIGIFGGSFNPPHLGHILAVEEFRERLALDTVLLIPAAVPPHKKLSANTPPAALRLEMTRLAVRDLPYALVSDIELRRGGTSYTADTLAALREEYPNDELFLLMGTDMLLSFSSWYHPERILREATLAVAHRGKDRAEELAECAARLEQTYGGRVVTVENRCLPYSSTSVRAMLAFGCGESYLAPSVMEYIRGNGLYYTTRTLKSLPLDKLREVGLSLLKPQRVRHVIGCSETAAALAEHYGENVTDAARAGALHDVTKALTAEEQLKLCEEYGMILNHFERENPKLLHAKTGAAVARRIFGENDAVCSAIEWHTTGRAGMTTAEKILYLADYMEPSRDFEGVGELRRLTWTNLDAAMLLGLEMTMRQLREKGSQIGPDSLAAYRYFHTRIC